MIHKHLHANRILGGADLTIGYQKERPPVIVGQNIEIPVGRISMLIGPNGSGKSTLLKTLSRQIQPRGGFVIMDGRNLASMGVREIARTLGILFQENNAPNDLTVEELVYHGRYPHRRLFDALSPEDRFAVEQALALSGADRLRHRPISQISSGQKQLAWIAMLLAQSPHYLFLDEPTTYLDLPHQFDVMNLVRRLNRELGNTIVITMHDLNLAARYGDHIFALHEGRIVAAGRPEEVLTTQTLRTVFDVESRLFRDEQTGSLHCVPIGRRPPGSERR